MSCRSSPGPTDACADPAPTTRRVSCATSTNAVAATLKTFRAGMPVPLPCCRPARFGRPTLQSVAGSRQCQAQIATVERRSGASLTRPCDNPPLLTRHRDAEPLLWIDEVVVVVRTYIELHPVDLAGEAAALGGVIGRHGCSGFVSDVGGLVGGEDHRLCRLDPTRAHRIAVVVERDVAPFGEPTAVVCELDAHLVVAGGDSRVGFGRELLDAEHVVDELDPAAFRVEGPPTKPTALGDDHALGAGPGDVHVCCDREGLVLDAYHAVLRQASHAR